MLKPVKTCKVCKIVSRGDLEGKKLLKRIYESRAYVRGAEPLTAIVADYQGRPDAFTYLSIHKHCQKHQGIDADTLANSRIARANKSLENDRIREMVKHTDVRQEIMEAAAKLLQDPEWVKKIKPSDALKAAKDTSDIEEKHLDRQMEVMKMVNAFASGEIVRPEAIEAGSTEIQSGRP
jgi:hypothetical protein